MEEIKLPKNAMDQRYPRYLYERFKFLPGEFTKYFLYKIELGYYYKLDGIIAHWPFKNQFGVDVYSDFTLEFETIDRNRKKNNIPVSINLFGNPNGNAMVALAPAPVDDKGFNVNLTADKVKNWVPQDEVFLFRSSIYFTITMKTILPVDTYFDFLLKGYNEPEMEVSDYTT